MPRASSSTLSSIDLCLEEHEVVIVLRGARHEDADLQAVLDRAEAVGGAMSSGTGELVIRIPADAEELVQS